ncbi:MAG TPA: hypothetical protein VMF06_02300 [Candidatus Limnocylindria bacterium]|jgi:hypothetical protein|nr:hypothetical protein [Candidatus Limnocylindria bacterium]
MRYDGTDFVDADDPTPNPHPVTPAAVSGSQASRAPTREELDRNLTVTQQELEKIRERKEQLERERAVLEESRRRRAEFQTGREEMKQSLIRGIGILEKTEFEFRRDSGQMLKSLQGLREALDNVSELKEDQWTQDNWDNELSRALTTIENARNEWNSARVDWPVLDGKGSAEKGGAGKSGLGLESLANMPLAQLCRIGLGLTWPVAAVALVALVVFAVALFKH